MSKMQYRYPIHLENVSVLDFKIAEEGDDDRGGSGGIDLPKPTDWQVININGFLAEGLEQFGGKAQKPEYEAQKLNAVGNELADILSHDPHPLSQDPRTSAVDSKATSIPWEDPEASVKLQNELNYKLQKQKQHVLAHTNSAAPTLNR